MMKEYSKSVLREMFDGQYVSPELPYVSLNADKETVEIVTKGNGRISLSGVQPKFAMVVENGQFRLTHEGEQGTYILKPAPTALFLLDRDFCPANEYVTMQLARQVYGIATAPCALCYFGNGQEAYVTRRFDIKPDGTKFRQEDFAQIAGVNRSNAGPDYKYNSLSYEDCAQLIRDHVKAAQVELLKFFRLVLFNYLTLNDDVHIKNFSLIERKVGDFVLAPAYDLLNTSLHLAMPSVFALKKGLFKEGTLIDDTHGITRASFIEFGIRIGLPERILTREMERFSKQYPLADQIIQNSTLPSSLQKDYLMSYNYRRYTISK